MAASPETSSGSGSFSFAAEAGCLPWAPESEDPPIPDSGSMSRSLGRAIGHLRKVTATYLGRRAKGLVPLTTSGRNCQGDNISRLNDHLVTHRCPGTADRIGQAPQRAARAYHRGGYRE